MGVVVIGVGRGRRVGLDISGNGIRCWRVVLVVVVAPGLVRSRFRFCFWEQDVYVEFGVGAVVGRLRFEILRLKLLVLSRWGGLARGLVRVRVQQDYPFDFDFDYGGVFV